eukprot:NODE_72_length_24857_cov_0.454399.p5 type:complete len:375 gc:universal NODE_72_length_24857_cov_0.454399:12255-13379(+)
MIFILLVLGTLSDQLEYMMLNGHQRVKKGCFTRSKQIWGSDKVIDTINNKQLTEIEWNTVVDYALHLYVCGDVKLFDHFRLNIPLTLAKQLVAMNSEHKIAMIHHYIGNGKLEITEESIQVFIEYAMNPFHLELFTELRNKEPVLAAKLAVKLGNVKAIMALLNIAQNSNIDVHIQDNFRLLNENTEFKILVDLHLNKEQLINYYHVLQNNHGNQHCLLAEAYAVRNPKYFEFANKEGVNCDIVGLDAHQIKLALVMGATQNIAAILASKYEAGMLLETFNQNGIFDNLPHGIADQYTTCLWDLIEKITNEEELTQLLKIFYFYDNCKLFQKLLQKLNNHLQYLSMLNLAYKLIRLKCNVLILLQIIIQIIRCH